MQSRIIPVAEARALVNRLLADEDKRCVEILTFDLAKVNLCISMANKMHNSLSISLKCSKIIDRYNHIVPQMENGIVKLNIKSFGYQISQVASIIESYNSILSLQDKLTGLLSDLEQHKHNLKELSKTRELLSQRVHRSEDPEKESKGIKDKDNRTIEEAGDIFALQIFEAYDSLMEKYKESESKIATLQKQKEQEEKN